MSNKEPRRMQAAKPGTRRGKHRDMERSMRYQGSRMYRVKAVAEKYEVSVNTIYRAIESGQLNALKMGTGKGTLRIPESELAAYEQACAQAAESFMTGDESAVGSDEQIGEVV